MKNLQVHKDKQYLQWEDGKPFFFMGDTAWEIFHKLSREDIDYYLSVRKKQGFNVIQAVALAEFDGLATPNFYGKCPLKKTNDKYDPLSPDQDSDYNYWDHVDYTIQKAKENDLFIGLLPTWGDKYNIKWGVGPEIFTSENAYLYGNWIANRYKDDWNIIWVLGGDRPLETIEHQNIIDSMAKGIREVDTSHLITFHPMGTKSSVEYVYNKDYIDFHSTQSGHGTEGYQSHILLRKTFEQEQKPFMDMEPRYEDHPSCFNVKYNYLWNAQDVRHNAYWNLMEGVCGHTYGNHSIWSFNEQPQEYFPYHWKDVLHHDGANQICNIVKLRMSRNFFEFRHAPELVDSDAMLNYQSSGRGDLYAFIYTPLGLPINANIDKFTDSTVKASWFNPITGEETVYKILPPNKTTIAPPTYGEDWIFILDVMA